MKEINSLIWTLKKDTLLFVRERRSTFMLFLLPLIIMAVVGSVFGLSGAQVTLSLPIGICNNDEGNISQQFIDAVHANAPLKYYTGDCKTPVTKDVYSGTTIVGMMIPRNFTNSIIAGTPPKVELLIDNSRAQVSWVSEATVHNALTLLSKQISLSFILSAWQSLTNAKERVNTLITSTDALTAEFADTNQKLVSAEGYVSSIDTTVIKQKLDEYVSDLSEATTILTNANNQIKNVKNNLNSNYDLFCPPPKPGCSVIQTTLDSLGQIELSLQTQITTVESVKTNILTTRDEFVTQLELLKEESTQAITDAKTTMNELIANTESVKSMLIEANASLTQILTREPEAIISPILVDSKAAFPSARYIDFLMPGILGVTIMFIALFLSSVSFVREKNWGTFTRNMLAPVSLFLFVVQKAVSALLLTVTPIFIIFIIAAFGFSVFIPISSMAVLILAMILLALAFIGVGLMIATFSDSENTAFLGSMLVGIPILFVSGIFFPFEMMPSFMSTAAQFIPTAAAIETYRKVVFYGAGLNVIQPFLLYLSAVAAVSILIAYLVVKYKRVMV